MSSRRICRYPLEAMRRDGVVGIRFQWKGMREQPDLASPAYRVLLRRVRDLDWHVHVHDDGPRLPAVLAALDAAGVRTVVDHFGRPDPALGLDCPGFRAVLAAVERGRTWVKLSAGYRFVPPAAARAHAEVLLRHAGPERLLWASDWPFLGFESTMDYQRAIDDLADWVPDPAMRRRIGGETALRFYFDA